MNHRIYTTTAALLCLGACILRPAPASAQGVGMIRVHIAPTSITFPPSKPKIQVFKSFSVTNNTECGITLSFRNSGSRSFSSVFMGLSNTGEIMPGRSAGCRVFFQPTGSGAFTGRTTITFRYGPSCHQLVRKQVLDDFKPRIAFAMRERDTHNRAGPKYKPLDEAHKRAGVKHSERIKTLKARAFELRTQSPDVDRLTQRRALWRQKIRTRERKLVDRLTQLKTQGVDLSGLNRVLADITTRGQAAIARVQQDTNAKCDLVPQLTQDMNRAIGELRSGILCAACKRPPTRIRRETGQSFREHIRKVGQGTIRGAPTHIINKERRIWQQKIDAAVRACNNARPRPDRERKKWKVKYDQVSARREKLKQRHAKRIGQLEQRLADLRQRWKLRDKLLSDQIDAADARRLKQLRETEARIKKAEADWRQAKLDYRTKRAKIAEDHRKRANTLDRNVRTLEQKRDAALRKAQARLKRTHTVTVPLSGSGM